jgi:hypothetical protein
VAFQNGELVRVFLNGARIEIPPVRPAGDNGQCFFFTPAADEQGMEGLGCGSQ